MSKHNRYLKDIVQENSFNDSLVLHGIPIDELDEANRTNCCFVQEWMAANQERPAFVCYRWKIRDGRTFEILARYENDCFLQAELTHIS